MAKPRRRKRRDVPSRSHGSAREHTAARLFFLNGERVKFKGVCLHHDLGSIGAEWNASAFRRQVRLLKEIGVNTIRTAHNQPNAELLDICDEEGIYVMAESFDAGKMGGSRWYAGGGIVRDVWLVVKSPVSVDRHGLYVKALKGEGDA